MGDGTLCDPAFLGCERTSSQQVQHETPVTEPEKAVRPAETPLDRGRPLLEDLPTTGAARPARIEVQNETDQPRRLDLRFGPARPFSVTAIGRRLGPISLITREPTVAYRLRLPV